MFKVISETRKAILEDFRRNKERYFSMIRQISKENNGKAYVFGSYVKGGWKGGSDVDILIVIPDDANRIAILNEISEKIRNPIFEFHVIHEKEEKFYLRMIKDFKPL